ncbi:MAG: glycosyltransferase [Candidatus Pacebacteria bacterium]|nr:glycosyltransferase [Candidatus Paceibacterota bacterium]
MKILMLTPYLPYPLLSGGQIRTYNLLKHLAKKHEITLFALIKQQSEKKYVKEIAPFCQKVKVFKRSTKPFTLGNILRTGLSSYPFLVMRNYVPQAIQAIEQELANNDYDLIHAETFYMMPHLPETQVPIILVEQTIEYLGYESYANKAPFFLRPVLQIDINKIKRWEKHYWKKADQLIVMSQKDKLFINQLIKDQKKTKVVANGVDYQWFNQISRQLPDKPTFLYVGTFKWLPNIEAAEFLVEQVWDLIRKQLPQAQLKIVGNAPTPKILNYHDPTKGIQVTGRVKDIRQAFKGSHTLIAPVFSGRGTRYKILEAMASGTPIVASATAVEGLNLTSGQQVLVTNDPDKMAELSVQLIKNHKLWHKLAKNGQKFVQQHYDWPLIAGQLDQIYQSI